MTYMLNPATLTAIIVSISFAAGLNTYATIFALGVMARLHWLVLPPGLDSLAHTWIIVVSGICFAAEFIADKIPALDLVWNALHTFVRIPAAALLAYAAGNHLSPVMHIFVTALGAAIAAVAHTSKTAARAAVTPSPEPVSNIALSSTEDAAAIGLSYVALHHPIATGVTVGILTLAAALLIWRTWSYVRARIRGYRSRRSSGSNLLPEAAGRPLL